MGRQSQGPCGAALIKRGWAPGDIRAPEGRGCSVTRDCVWLSSACITNLRTITSSAPSATVTSCRLDLAEGPSGSEGLSPREPQSFGVLSQGTEKTTCCMGHHLNGISARRDPCLSEWEAGTTLGAQAGSAAQILGKAQFLWAPGSSSIKRRLVTPLRPGRSKEQYAGVWSFSPDPASSRQVRQVCRHKHYRH